MTAYCKFSKKFSVYTGKETLMAAEQVNVEIGRKIKNLRNRNGLTQQELADRTELTKGFISQLERRCRPRRRAWF